MSSNIKEFHEKISSRKEYWIPLLFYTFAAYGFSMLNRTVGADDLATPLYVNDTVWLRELRWGAVLWKKLFSFGDCVPYLDKFLSVCLLMLAGTAFSCILFMINAKKERVLLYTIASCSFSQKYPTTKFEKTAKLAIGVTIDTPSSIPYATSIAKYNKPQEMPVIR